MQHKLLLLSSFASLSLFGCPSNEQGGDTPDAPAAGACSDTTAPAVTLNGLRFEACELRGLGTAQVRELAVGSDGALYLLTGTGDIQRFAAAGTGCSFERDASYATPDAEVASIEGTSDGRLYYTYRSSSGDSVLGWDGASEGACSSPSAFRPEIAAAGDGSVVLAPATGPGLIAVNTAGCTTSPLGFVGSETPRVFGRAGTDVLFGGPVDTGVARYTFAGVEKYKLTDHAFAGRDGHTLEQLGARIASYAIGYVFSVDAETGAALPPIDADDFFATSASDGAKQSALLDVAPDGASAYVLGIAAGTGTCAATTYLYKLTPSA